MEPIEWVFTILSFVAYYFFISKKAGQANFRIIGLTLCLLIAALTSVFCFSLGVMSLVIINAISSFFNVYGIYNCYKEIKTNKNEGKKGNKLCEIEAEELIKKYPIEFQKLLAAKLNEQFNTFT